MSMLCIMTEHAVVECYLSATVMYSATWSSKFPIMQVNYMAKKCHLAACGL